MNLTEHEQALLLELTLALSSSLDLAEVLARSRNAIQQLLPCDYAALCVSRPDHPGDYEWMALGAPGVLFAHYPELAAMDFVRPSAPRSPHAPSYRELKRNLLYLRSRELGLPLEQVMAVLLDLRPGWHGGFTLYREQTQPFSEREQALLDRLTPHLSNTVRNCRMFGEAAMRGDLLDALFHHQGAECIVMETPERETLRTPRAMALLQHWYPDEIKASDARLPHELRDRLRLLRTPLAERTPGRDTVLRPGLKNTLRVTFVELPEQRGVRPWGLVLQEFSHAIPLPESWRQTLSSREVEVVECVLRNASNEAIAEELGLALNTVKTHLRNIFPKLRIDSRTDLLYQAASKRLTE
jgi:DNA-binding CsgD family transcriptional regulator